MKKKSYLESFSIFPVLFLVCLISISFPLSVSSVNPEINISGVEEFDNEFPEDPEGIWEIIRKDVNADHRNGQGFPPIWNEVVQTDKIHGYILNLAAIPRVNEIPLQYGDYVGGFYLRDGERFCGGARMWTGTENVILTLFGNDGLTPIKDGFAGGELIEFRFFLQATQKEYLVSIMSYYVSPGYVTNGRWYNTSLSMVMNMKAVKNMDFFIQIADNPICINNQVSPSAQEFIGTGGPYTFSWSSDPPGYNHTVQTPPPIVLDVTTDFFLTVTDPNYVSEHQITVLVYDHPTANAGSNGVICANETFAVSGGSTNALNVEWTTSGDGSFANPNQAATVYTPGENDKLNGSVVLTFSAEPYSPCSVIDSDNLTLNVLPLPSVFAGEDINACGNETVIITATATNFDLAYWTTSGSGSFSNPSSLTTQYNPSSTDITNGVTLTICVTAINPCVLTACDQMQISYLPGPTAATPNIIRRCEGVTFSISGSVSNNSGVLWTTQGDGTFANPNVIPAIYTPGPQDIANFGTIVTLNSIPIAPCDVPASKDVALFIQQLPSVVTFGPNTDYACKDSYLQLAAEAYEYTSIAWTRIGDGTFSSTNVLNPKYYPGPNDKLNGYFTLILSLAPKQYCSVGTTVQKTVQIIDNPTVQISTPSNQHVCADVSFPVTGLASSYQSVLWTTLGDGSFGNQNALTTQYNPGPGDVSSGANIKLTLLASPVAPCEVAAEAFILVRFKQPPSANAGNNATICENQTYQLTGTANAYSSISWQTSGSGSFNNTGILQPVYTSSAQDALNGSVILTLTSQPNSPCAVAASDQMVLTIQRLSTANAGINATVCENQNHTLNGSAARYSSVLWTTSGTGTFSNPNSLSPSYILSAGDKLLPSLTLTLTAQPISPCAVSASDTKVLSIQRLSTANAGLDASICENQNHTLSGSALRYSTVQWTTSGTGTFNNNGILSPVYTPSAADKLAGSLILTLTAQPISPCAVSASDTKVLTIQQLSTANAGADALICGDDPHQLNGQATNYATLIWTTSGTGAFSNPAILNPTYTPSAADKLAGTVILTFTAQPVSPCSVAATDQKTLTIDILEVENDLMDTEVNVGATTVLNFDVTSFTAGTFVWYFNGVAIPNATGSSLTITNAEPADAGYYQSIFTNNCGTATSNEVLVEVIQLSTHQMILQNGWSGISSYVTPANPAMESIFAGVVNNLEIISDNYGVFWPGQNVNTLGDWSVNKGYKIKMTSASQLAIAGAIRYPLASVTVPSGWSYLPVTSTCAVDVVEQFGAIASVRMIKDIAGTGIYWPAYGVNTLQQLLPGKAYEIYNLGNPFVVKYPLCDPLPLIAGFKEGQPEIIHHWNVIHKTPASHVFGFIDNAAGVLEQGDIVAGFTQSAICAGVTQVDQRGSMIVLTTFGTDQIAEAITGFTEGEPLKFVLFRPSTNTEYDLEVNFAPQSLHDGTFTSNGISLINNIELMTTGIGNGVDLNKDLQVEIFPNPTTGLLNINITSDLPIQGELMISNAAGQLILKSSIEHSNGLTQQSFDLSGNPVGVYYLRIVADDVLQTRKIILR